MAVKKSTAPKSGRRSEGRQEGRPQEGRPQEGRRQEAPKAAPKAGEPRRPRPRRPRASSCPTPRRGARVGGGDQASRLRSAPRARARSSSSLLTKKLIKRGKKENGSASATSPRSSARSTAARAGAVRRRQLPPPSTAAAGRRGHVLGNRGLDPRRPDPARFLGPIHTGYGLIPATIARLHSFVSPLARFGRLLDRVRPELILADLPLAAKITPPS